MSMTNRTAQAMLNSLFGRTSNFGALGSAPSMHVALSTTAPAEDGTNVTEPVGNGYARQPAGASVWNDATLADPSLIDNQSIIDFGTATGSWGTVTHVVIFDALTAGNVIASGALTTSRTISNNDPVSFQAGDIDVTLD